MSTAIWRGCWMLSGASYKIERRVEPPPRPSPARGEGGPLGCLAIHRLRELSAKLGARSLDSGSRPDRASGRQNGGSAWAELFYRLRGREDLHEWCISA
jgi:hypothetical protein